MIKEKEQLYTQGCLPVALAMICDKKMSKSQEGDIMLKGLMKKYFVYFWGMVDQFSDAYKCDLNVYVHYKKFAIDSKAFLKGNKRLKVENKAATIQFIKKLVGKSPIVLYVDAHFLPYDVFSTHAPHFVVIEKIEGKIVTIVDPWDGLRKQVTEEVLKESLAYLRTGMLFSPVIITRK